MYLTNLKKFKYHTPHRFESRWVQINVSLICFANNPKFIPFLLHILLNNYAIIIIMFILCLYNFLKT